MGEATDTILEMAGIREGSQVLDVAAGTGGQTMVAARRVGLQGSVLATDISANILAYASENARLAGLSNIQTRVLDGENLQLTPASFDAVISRVGLIYFPDQHKALTGMFNALKPGGKLAAIVYSTADNNKFFSIPVGIIRRLAKLPPPLPGQPGPFSLGATGVVEGVLAKAGFQDIQTKVMSAPLRMASASDCIRFERESFGALHQMLASLTDEGRELAWQEIAQELSVYEGPAGFVGPCEIIVVSGTK